MSVICGILEITKYNNYKAKQSIAENNPDNFVKDIFTKLIPRDKYDNPNVCNIALNDLLEEVASKYLITSLGSHVWFLQLDYGEILPAATCRALPSIIADAEHSHVDAIAFPVRKSQQEIRLVRYTGAQFYWGGPDRYVSGVSRVKVYDMPITWALPLELRKEWKAFNERSRNIYNRKNASSIIFNDDKLPPMDFID